MQRKQVPGQTQQLVPRGMNLQLASPAQWHQEQLEHGSQHQWPSAVQDTHRGTKQKQQP